VHWSLIWPLFSFFFLFPLRDTPPSPLSMHPHHLSNGPSLKIYRKRNRALAQYCSIIFSI
jgi:hypothetical protein